MPILDSNMKRSQFRHYFIFIEQIDLRIQISQCVFIFKFVNILCHSSFILILLLLGQLLP